MPKKMSRRLVALSASAVASVYLAGLLSTRTAADSISASVGGDTATVSTPVPTIATSGADATSVPAVVVGASATATPASTATPTTPSTATPAATPTSAASTATPAAGPSSTSYADGTYTATGSSRFGSVAVSVTTSGGKIGNVQITKVTTTFPVSRIASLPAQVVQTQTASVNAVTGATASSQAFKQAVQQALAQALGARSTAAAG